MTREQFIAKLLMLGLIEDRASDFTDYDIFIDGSLLGWVSIPNDEEGIAEFDRDDSFDIDLPYEECYSRVLKFLEKYT